MRKGMFAAVAVLVLGVGVQTASANLLSNGDFEAGNVDWTNIGSNDFSAEDWANGAPGDGGAPPVYGLGGDGQLGLAAKPWTDNDNADEEFSQTVAGIAGLSYTFSIQTHVGANFLPFAGGPIGTALDAAADTAPVFMRFLDSGGGTLAGSQEVIIDENNAIRGSLPPPGAENSADWQTWILNGVAPAGTVEVQVGGGWTNGRDAFGDEGAMRWDNADLIPEPGSLALLGLGTLLIASRRRRNS